MTVPVISFLTMKGGVGKTTLAANITRALADRKKRKILLIDADSQCNLSQVFFEDDLLEARDSRSIFHAFDTGGRAMSPGDVKTTIFPPSGASSPNGSAIDFVQGSFDTFELNATKTTSKRTAAAERFRSFIEEAKRTYDLVVIDTNPSATFVTMQALANSNFLVAPITLDAFSMQGIHLVVHHLSSDFDWLTNPLRLCLVTNKVTRSPTDAEIRRQRREEDKIRERYPYLSPRIKLERIHKSDLIANRATARGFIADNNGIDGGTYSKIVEDFDSIAKAIDLDLENAFGSFKKQSEKSAKRTGWWPLKGIGGVSGQ